VLLSLAWVHSTRAASPRRCLLRVSPGTFLSAMHSRIERRDLRQHLRENLWDQERGEENRAELWLRFAEAVGVGREEVVADDPEVAVLTTSEALDAWWGFLDAVDVGGASSRSSPQALPPSAGPDHGHAAMIGTPTSLGPRVGPPAEVQL